MSDLVHPMFNLVALSNLPMAEALSEFTIPGRIKRFTMGEEIAEFPPEPSYFIGACATYLTNDSESPKCQIAIVRAEAVNHLLDGYEPARSFAQSIDDIVIDEENGLTLTEKLRQELVAGVRRSKQKLVSGFILFRSLDEQRFSSTFIFPELVIRELPLVARQEFMKLYLEMERAGDTKYMPAEMRESYKAILRNDKNTQGFGMGAALSFLPTVEEMSRYIYRIKAQYVPPTST